MFLRQTPRYLLQQFSLALEACFTSKVDSVKLCIGQSMALCGVVQFQYHKFSIAAPFDPPMCSATMSFIVGGPCIAGSSISLAHSLLDSETCLPQININEYLLSAQLAVPEEACTHFNQVRATFIVYLHHVADNYTCTFTDGL